MKDALNQVGEGWNVDQGREVRESFKDGLQDVNSGSLTFFSVFWQTVGRIRTFFSLGLSISVESGNKHQTIKQTH